MARKGPALKVADSSIAIAAFSDWHPRHPRANDALASDRSVGIVAHAAFETFSVLTRMPEPHRMAAAVVSDWLEDTFADRWIGLPATALRHVLRRLVDNEVDGGSTYDALIAVTAAASDATLLTMDARALPTYQLLGARVEVIA